VTGRAEQDWRRPVTKFSEADRGLHPPHHQWASGDLGGQVLDLVGDQMDLGNILRTIGRRSLLIVGFVLLGIVVAGFTQLEFGSGGLVPKAGKYRSQARIFIDLPRVDPEVANTSVLRLITTPTVHVQVIQSQSFAEEISERVDGAYSAAEIKDDLVAWGIIPSYIVIIEVAGDTPEDAVALAEAAGATYVDWLATRQDEAGVPEKNRMTAEIVEPPRVENVESTGGQVRRWLIFGGIVGATLGIVLAFGMAPPEPKVKVRKLKSKGPGRTDDAQPARAPEPAMISGVEGTKT
jgi:capsular polysaccharide biosynthesis protein